MITILFLAAACFVLYRLLGGAPQLRVRRHQPAEAAKAKIEEMTDYASKLRTNNNYTGAEKVYLQILKIDHRHTGTYSRLGTLYIAMKNYSDAIECFQLATQMSPSGATFYNLGLASYENRNPMKAIAAFEKAIMFEPSAQRYVGLAKAFSKVGDSDSMVNALEQAAELDSSPKVLWLWADACEAAGRFEEMQTVRDRIRAATPRDPRLKRAPRLEKTQV